jgi:hypothetical protein
VGSPPDVSPARSWAGADEIADGDKIGLLQDWNGRGTRESVPSILRVLDTYLRTVYVVQADLRIPTKRLLEVDWFGLMFRLNF